MKPLKLTMRNAGPFKFEEVDFTKLENMFLVCGNTGAGKTSIFDAITFALYGKLNGGRGNTNGARDFYSTYATENEEGCVVFKFEIFGKTYQITRTIPRVYINRNGAETTSNSTLEFGEIDKNGNLANYNGNKKELDEKIEKLIGFNHDDFSRIVVLPQGQFAEFLKQKSSTRKETLSKLFDVASYKAIVDDAKNLFDEKKKNASALEIALKNLQEKFNPETAKEEIQKYENEISKTEKSLSEQNAAQENAIAEKSKLESAYKIAVENENNRRKLDLLNKQKDAIEQKQKTILLAEEAASYENLILNASDSKNELDLLGEKKRQKENALEKNKNSIALIKEKFCALCKNQNEIQNEFEVQREKLQSASDALQAQKNLLEKAKEKDALQNEISILNTETENANANFERAQKLVKSTEGEIKELEDLDLQNEIQNASIILVKQLKENAPCPICGSLEHPVPFVYKKTEFNIKEKLAEKNEQLKLNQKMQSNCEIQTAKLKTKLEEKSVRLNNFSADLPSLKNAQDNCNKAEYDFNAMKNLFKTLTELKNNYDMHLQENTSLQSALKIISENFETAQKKSVDAADALQKALSASSFGSLEKCRAAMLEKQQIANLKNEVSAWKEEIAKLGALVESQKDCEKSEIIQEKITALNKTLAATKEKIDALNKTLLQNQTGKNELQKLNDNYNKNLLAMETLQKEIVPYEMLFNDLSQHNPKGISFDTWVLAYYFTEVVSYANKRFSEISQGRYEFKISEQGGGNGYKGLDLLVTDSYTGKDRDTSTLSGGETFMASISLALALTDVVQNRNGGIQLDSIFIDEGFGTLDEETLNCAMSILNDLQETKMVGLISHIESMRTQIPSHIEVQKTMSGSHIKIV